MSNWITYKKTNDFTYVLSEPLFWEDTHAYLLLGDEYALLIDTLTGIENILDVVKEITKLPLKVVITHAHYDHFNGMKNFDGIDIFCHKDDTKWLRKYYLSDEEVREEISSHNQKFPEDFNINNYKVEPLENYKLISEKDEIDLGNRKIKVIHTPGHTPGSICLLDEKYKILFSGDFLYKGELECYYEGTNPQDYLISLIKISNLNVNMVLGGHYNLDNTSNLISDTYQAFLKVKEKSNNFKNKGIYTFKDFSIRI